MKTRWIGVAATALIVCTGPAWARGDKQAQPEQQRAATLTASAWTALGKGDAKQAVADAEAATLLLPDDAGTRALLGRAYLAAGRFGSAETAFGDALTLDPTLSRVVVNRALAQIALGKADQARASLASVDGKASDSDIGLALALLGDSDAARTRLDAAARAAGADARARQNLGLAFALEGRWTDAAAVAEQDVPGNLMPQRLRRWAMIAQLKADPAMQIGAVLGVLPTADAGQPAALALAAPSQLPAATIPVVMAAAPPSPPPFIALVAPIIREEGGAVVTQTSFTLPSLDRLVTGNDVTPPSISAVSDPAVAAAPAMAAWAGPPRMRKARVVEAPPPAAAAKTPVTTVLKPAVRPAAPRSAPSRPILLASALSLKPLPLKGGEGWAVQLGAFSSMQRTEIAWGKLSGRVAFLNAYKPTGSSRRFGKAMLYGLSVSGLTSRQDAVRLCVRIKASGGTCFVRTARGDRPMQWALRTHMDAPA